MVRRNLEKIRGVLARMDEILSGLTRGLDLSVLDAGISQSGPALSFVPRGLTLGIVLPSNSPGVHALWVPAIALKTALVLKPGSAEPWTPYRLIQAFLRAGAPPEAFAYYPAEHAAAAEILRRCGRGMLFGDLGAVGSFKHDPRIELHGPGYSKVLLGPDAADRWEQLPGRDGRVDRGELGPLVRERLGGVDDRARGRDRGSARGAPGVDRGRATPRTKARSWRRSRTRAWRSGSRRWWTTACAQPGARDVTAAHREGGRLVTSGRRARTCCPRSSAATPDHPLANREFLFPFASVVEVRPEEMPGVLGPTLTAHGDHGRRRRCGAGCWPRRWCSA